MKIRTNNRRRFERYPVDVGLLFSDNDNLIGMAKVIDISDCGVKCGSLSRIKCTICMLENIELFVPEENMAVTGLSGKMTRCSDIKNDQDSGLKLFYCEFGFEFLRHHYNLLHRLKKSLHT